MLAGDGKHRFAGVIAVVRGAYGQQYRVAGGRQKRRIIGILNRHGRAGIASAGESKRLPVKGGDDERMDVLVGTGDLL